jgi:hypothetical protein
MSKEQASSEPTRKSWKQRLGVGLFIYSIIPLCTVEILAFLPLTAGQAVAFGAVYVASGEIAFLAAVALLGKPFIQSIKDKIKSIVFRRRAPSAPTTISRFLHWIGVTLLVLSVLPYYLAILALLFAQPKAPDLRTLLYLLLSGEALFIVGLLVLGEEFWARLKRLFEWPGKEQVSGDRQT